MIPRFQRYVALGDSTTEGLEDPYEDGSGYRGWADRLAEALAAANPDLTYANLAIRGRKIPQIRAEQLGPALALRPDLASVVGGLNDILRRRVDLDAVAGEIEAMVASLREARATVILMTYPDPTAVISVAAGRIRARVMAFNSRIRSLARRCGAVLVDIDRDGVAHPALWCEDRLHANATGLIIANDGLHFSVGANLRSMLSDAEVGNWQTIDHLIAEGQRLFLALRAAPKPVVAAPFQRVLGGGAEICLAAHRVVAHAETMIGLVEFNVGLIPGWGGCKEMVRRHVRPDSPLTGLHHIMELITQAKTSSSAHEAKTMGLFAADDRVVMHRDYLIHAARQNLLELAERFTPVTIINNVYGAGTDALATLHADIEAQRQAGKFLEQDVVIASSLAHVLCGGGGDASWRNEADFLELERQQFLQLIRTPATQARIRQILTTGKPLRN